MTNSTQLLTGASQLAQLLVLKARPGFSTDYVDYLPQRVRFSGDAYNPMAPGFRPEIDPKGFLVENTATTAAGLPCVILSSPSGHDEVDRVTGDDGKPTTRRFAIWKKRPGYTPITGKGGGFKTDRGGWIKGSIDEVFVLIGNKLCCITLWDAHHVITDIQQQATPLPIAALYEARWQLTKVEIPDGDYFRREPHFELLGVVGEPNGPSEAELAHAKKLSGLISQLSYPHPDVPLRLVVNGPSYLDEAPSPDPDDPGPTPPDPPDDGLPDFLKR
jgi:hypothetical protein